MYRRWRDRRSSGNTLRSSAMDKRCSLGFKFLVRHFHEGSNPRSQVRNLILIFGDPSYSDLKSEFCKLSFVISDDNIKWLNEAPNSKFNGNWKWMQSCPWKIFGTDAYSKTTQLANVKTLYCTKSESDFFSWWNIKFAWQWQNK